MNTDIRITILIDNIATRPDVLSEHGLSLWIEYGRKYILWDTGQSDSLLANAKTLGVDLALTEIIALSHGHYDHTGGLSAALAVAPQARVYIHPMAIRPRYSKKEFLHSIGMPFGVVQDLETRPVNRVESWTQIGQGIFLTGPIPRQNPLENTGGAFFWDLDCRIPDALPDDQALVLESAKGLVVILGCAHSGTINTLDYISRKTGQHNIYAIIGGMHLGSASEQRLDCTIKMLRQYDVQLLVPLHCTGTNAIQYLQNGLSKKTVQPPQSPYLELK
jgi:7,8-dihydropterin-6-yl-methyl-4-(beta-D-ribofuranosyl)aminobenzene 5'-phosphate synthase